MTWKLAWSKRVMQTKTMLVSGMFRGAWCNQSHGMIWRWQSRNVRMQRMQRKRFSQWRLGTSRAVLTVQLKLLVRGGVGSIKGWINSTCYISQPTKFFVHLIEKMLISFQIKQVFVAHQNWSTYLRIYEFRCISKMLRPSLQHPWQITKSSTERPCVKADAEKCKANVDSAIIVTPSGQLLRQFYLFLSQ